MSHNVFAGVMPALMTPCKADRTPDFDALVRKGKELVCAGMAGVIYCGSMGDWPLLTDEQRMTGVEGLVQAGLRVIVGTGAQNPMRAAALAAHAKQTGAAGLMVIPRVLSRGSSAAAQYAHFAGILEAAVDLPAVIYNSPYYGFATRAELFFALHEKYPHLVGFKEFGGADALSYAAEHITGRSQGSAGPPQGSLTPAGGGLGAAQTWGHTNTLTLMVGVDTEVFHGYVNCGARGAITGIGNVLPREVVHLATLCEKAAQGDAAARRQAQELEAGLKVLSTFDVGVDLVLYYKYLMLLEGNPEYELHFNPGDALSESQKTFARNQLRLFKTWYAQWVKTVR